LFEGVLRIEARSVKGIGGRAQTAPALLPPSPADWGILGERRKLLLRDRGGAPVENEFW